METVAPILERRPAAPAEFSLAAGGPFYDLLRGARLSTSCLGLLHRRVVALSVVAWLPLLVLSALAGRALGGVTLPFLGDVSVHARFVLCLPLLLAAESFVQSRVQAVVQQFPERGLIANEDLPCFERAVRAAHAARDSYLAEMVVLLLAFTGGYWLWSQRIATRADSWYTRDAAHGGHLTVAGYWLAFVALPIFRFVLFRWYWRLLIWCRLLWQLSRIPLQLKPLHPDRAGGLGFLNGTVIAFAPVLLAHTLLLSGGIADHIWHEGIPLPQFKLEIAIVVLVLVGVVLLPLTFFVTQLERARRRGSRTYGVVASDYVTDFERKWIRSPGSARDSEDILGSADIQSLADLANSFDVVREMTLMPFSKGTVIGVVAFIALPLAPLVLTMIPIEALIDRLFKVFLAA